MRILVVDPNNMFVQDEFGQILLQTRPVFQFPYEAIVYNHVTRTKWVRIGDEVIEAAIESQEIEQIENFINAARAEHGIHVDAVDAGGIYLGKVKDTDERIYQKCLPPPTNDNYVWDFQKEEWVFIHAVDDEGNYIGNVPYSKSLKMVPSAPEPTAKRQVWDFLEERYVEYKKTVPQRKSEVQSKMDNINRIRREALTSEKNGAVVRREINNAIVQILEKHGLTLLAEAQKTKAGLAKRLRETDELKEIDDIDATLTVLLSELSIKYRK